MKRIIRLTESDLARIVKRVIMEQDTTVYMIDGLSWTHIGTDTIGPEYNYNGKFADVQMKNVPKQGEKALSDKTWTVGCNGSVVPAPTSGKDKLQKIALKSLSCKS